jgi:hypothetical protein
MASPGGRLALLCVSNCKLIKKTAQAVAYEANLRPGRDEATFSPPEMRRFRLAALAFAERLRFNCP